MSAAASKTQSARMRAYWAAKGKEEGKKQRAATSDPALRRYTVIAGGVKGTAPKANTSDRCESGLLLDTVIILRCAVSIFIAALALASGRPKHEIGENSALVGATMLGSAPSPTLLNEALIFPSKLLGTSHSAGQGTATVDASTSSEAQTVAGTTLVHFGEVDQGVYKGSEPKTDADYEFLKARHIKYILDLELLPSVRHSEQKKAKRYGIVLLHGRLNASPIPPSHKHIERIMAILRNKRYHPIYFHCAYGRDRTSLVAALYKMYFLGMSQQDALRYMDESGYKDSWVRGGLKRYLEKHPSSRSK